MSKMTLTINGRPHDVDVDPATPLLYVLSDDLQLRGPKFGCGLGQCGACTVIVKGQAIRSCVTPVSAVGGADVVTLDGLGTLEKPHPIQQAFIDEQAAQCGFCLNGVIMTAKAFVDRNPKASDVEIQRRCQACCADVSPTGGCCAPSNGMRRESRDDECIDDARSTRGARSRPMVSTRVPEGNGRPHRELRRRQRAGLDRDRQRPRGSTARAAPAGLLDCDRRRRPRHGVHREGGTRSGTVHGADPVDRRRARRAIDRVTLVQCDTATTPDQGTTSGSQSHPANFNQSNLALAAATAREALLQLASARLGAPVEGLALENGVISAKADPSKKVSYGELVGGKSFDIPLNRSAKRKPARRMDGAGQAGAATRSAGHGDRTIRIRAQRARAGDAARKGCPSAVGGCDAGGR